MPGQKTKKNKRDMSKNIAIILAGGSGSRFGRDLPKQFLKVAGKKVIEHTIDVFEHNELVDEIAVVTRPEFISDIEQMVVNNHYVKVRKILQGGKERYHSSLSAINAYTNDDDNLIFHDAVRPLVNDRIIDDCVKALEKYDAIDVAISVADTIIQVDEKDCIQTPAALVQNPYTLGGRILIAFLPISTASAITKQRREWNIIFLEPMETKRLCLAFKKYSRRIKRNSLTRKRKVILLKKQSFTWFVTLSRAIMYFGQR